MVGFASGYKEVGFVVAAWLEKRNPAPPEVQPVPRRQGATPPQRQVTADKKC